MAKKSTTKESLFVHYNPNPIFAPLKNGRIKRWDRGDCSLRAICGATDLEWEDAYKQASEYALEVFDCFNCDLGFENVMKRMGFKHISFGKIAAGSSRPTVESFSREHNDGKRYILRVSNHYVCSKDGHYYDVWDCGDKSVYSYWIKED